MPKPLFICGIMRTGTTVTQKVVDSHPQISITNELNIHHSWRDFNSMVHDSKRRREEGLPEEKFGVSLVHVPTVRRIADEGFKYGFQKFHERRVFESGGEWSEIEYFGDKCNPVYLYKEWIEERYPFAKFIVVRRNFRDTMASVKAAEFTQGHDFDHWLKFCSERFKKLNEVVGHSNVFVVEFDELQNDAEALFERLA